MTVPISYVGEPKAGTPVKIESFGDSARPTSIDIDVCGKGSFSIQASNSVMGGVGPYYEIPRVVFETVPILVTDAVVRHYKFRAPKSSDFGPHARWSIATTGTLRVSAVARFSRRTPVEWQEVKPPSDEEVVVVPQKTEADADILARRWRYANTVA